MTRTEIYIDGSLIDLSVNTVIASTFKAFEIGDLQTRNANYTNRFKVPNTPNNTLIFGFSNDVRSTTTRPYRKLPARIVQNGVEVISEAVAVINSYGDEFYNIEIYSGVYDFFDKLGDATIAELELSEYDTTELIKPFINYGQLDENASTLAMAGSELWSFPYRYVLDKIITQNGYSKQGEVFEDEKIQTMHFSGLGLEGYNDTFRDDKEFKARIASGGVTVTGFGIAGKKIPFTDVIKSSRHYNDKDTYLPIDPQAPQGGDYGGTFFTHYVYCQITFEFINTNTGLPAVELYCPTLTPYRVENTGGVMTATLELSERIPNSGVVSGSSSVPVYMRAIILGSATGTADIVVYSGVFYNYVLPDIFPAYISVAGILPELTQKEMLKDFAVRYGVLFSEKNGVFQARTIKEIISSKAKAVDWTNKRSRDVAEKITFDFQSYTQNNYLSYSHDDDNIIETLGQGNLQIDNENLELDGDLYTSPFKNCETRKMGNESAGYVTAAYIPVFDQDDEGSDPGLRLTMVRDKYDSEPTLAGSVSSYKVGYFIDELSPLGSLDLQEFIDDHYSELSASLQRVKFVERYYYLTELDIANLDLFRLVYDDGAYYLISQVYQYVPGEVTRVDLLKVL